jgi:hypothetical protein
VAAPREIRFVAFDRATARVIGTAARDTSIVGRHRRARVNPLDHRIPAFGPRVRRNCTGSENPMIS